MELIDDWYMQEESFYIKVDGISIDLNVLSKYVFLILFIWEIAYQITLHGVTRTLKKSKELWPQHPLAIEEYQIVVGS
jgi:hypothetical protein